MRRVFSFVTAAAFIVGLAAPMLAQAPAASTIKGEVVDHQCYLKDAKRVGESHASCALTCARKGSILAIVTSDGAVYTIAGDMTKESNKGLIEYVAKKVEATGTVTETKDAKSINVTAMKLQAEMKK